MCLLNETSIGLKTIGFPWITIVLRFRVPLFWNRYIFPWILPASDHGPGLIEIISLMIDRLPTGYHNGWRRIEVVFFTCFWKPSANCSSIVFIVISPFSAKRLPAGQPLTVFVKSVVVSVYKVSATYKVFTIVFRAFGGSELIELRIIFLLPVSCIIANIFRW